MKNVLFTCIALVALSACTTTTVPGSHIIGNGKEMQKIDPKSVHPSNEIYRLAARDVLLIQIDAMENASQSHKIDRGNQVRVVFTHNPSASYKITPGDQLTLEFPDEIEGLYEVLVSPDGLVTLPRLGKSMKVSGMTLAQLNKASIKQYKNLLLNPNLSWAIKRTFDEQLTRMSGEFPVGYDGAIVVPELGDVAVVGKTAKEVANVLTTQAREKFKNEITASASVSRVNVREQQLDTRLTTSGLLMYTNLANLPSRISDNGDVYVPHLGVVQAEGKTVQELKDDILKQAQPMYQNPIAVNVAIQEFADYNVFIGGEVRIPGRYTHSKKLSLLKLIAQAGWVNETADLANVLLVRADHNNRYTIYRTNLDEIFEGKGSSDQDFHLTPQDLVIVPPTGIAKANRAMAQYVRGLLPFTTSVSYNINTVPSQQGR